MTKVGRTLNLVEYPEIIFIIISLIFGLAILFLTPPFRVADEPVHFLRAIEVSNGNFYNSYYKYKNLYKNCDNNYFSSIHYIKAKKLLPNELKDYNIPIPNKKVLTLHNATGYSPIMYLVSGSGVNIAKTMNKNLLFAFYLARLFNLIFWTSIIALSIKITPIFKYPFLFCALLPMSIFQGMSVSADSYTNAISFLFIAFLFSLIYSKQEIKPRHLAVFASLSLLSSLAKISIFPIFLFLIIPNAKFKNLKFQKFTFFILILFLNLLLISLWQKINYTNIRSLVDFEMHRQIILNHPMWVLNYLIKTLFYKINNTYFLLDEIIGVLGWLNISFQPWLYNSVLFVFVSMFIFIKEFGVKISHRILSLLIICVFILSVFILMYLLWDDPRTELIEGVQGRYFIQILPLVFLLFAQNKINFSEKATKIYKICLVGFILLLQMLTCLVLLNSYWI